MSDMRYLYLGYGSVAEGEYIRNMLETRLCQDGTTRSEAGSRGRAVY
jgi:hypothetical protein